MTEDSEIKSNHHTVPQFYLKGFRDTNGKIAIWHRENGKISHQPIKNVARITHYYTVLDDNGNESDIIENIYAKLELRASRILSLMVGPLHIMPRFLSNERKTFSEYLAAQFIRVPKLRRASQLFFDHDWKAMLCLNLLNSKKTLNETQLNFLSNPHILGEVVQSQDTLIMQEIDMISILAPFFYYRPWKMLVFTKPSLITCDCPIFLLPFPGCSAGIGTAAEIWFPLDCKHLLIMGGPVTTYPLVQDEVIFQKDERDVVFSECSSRSNLAQLRNSYNGAYGRHENITRFKGCGLGVKPPVFFGNDSSFDQHYQDIESVSLEPLMGHGIQIDEMFKKNCS